MNRLSPSSTECLFVSDLHGSLSRYQALWREIAARRPALVFLGGDLLPSMWAGGSGEADFVSAVLGPGFARLRSELADEYPQVVAILGNDDGRAAEASMRDLEEQRLWSYAHGAELEVRAYTIFGYSYVPPTPFALKDWERYDVSRYVDPGSVSPEEGMRTVPVAVHEARHATIARDLARLARGRSLDRAVFLFHAPPYLTKLDRAALDGKKVDHVPMDPHVGSIAVRRFIETQQPLLTLHGHIHESARLSGSWRDRIGRTEMFSAAHDGPELALVQFDLERLSQAQRFLL